MRCLESIDPDGMIRQAVGTAGLMNADRQVSLLQGDGSDRKFYRLQGKAGRVIVLVSPRRRAVGLDENDSYAAIGRLLRDLHLPVPKFYHAAPESGWFVMEDAGDLHLQSLVARIRSESGRERAYHQVLRLLVRMHRSVPPRFRSDFCFDGAVYQPEFVLQRELEYFRKEFLNRYLGLTVELADLQPDFDRIAAEAGRPRGRQVLHRDFQSRNLMVQRGRLRLLDFQGMRWGPSVYDLASVLLDPYTKLSESLQERLAGLYWNGASGFLGGSRRAFMSDYEVVRLCRNLQILGAFAFLSQVKGKTFFEPFIPGAWQQLEAWLKRPFARRFPRLLECVAAAGANRTGSRASNTNGGLGPARKPPIATHHPRLRNATGV